MMPVLAIVRIRHPRGGFAIWAPVILLWPLVAALGLVLSPVLTGIALAKGRNPVAIADGLRRLVFSLSGLVVEVESPAASVLVRLI
jgi:hypothetical protein